MKRHSAFLFLGVCLAQSLVAQTATLTPDIRACRAEGGTITLTATANYVGSPRALGWEVELPPGWAYVSGTNEPDIKPVAGRTQKLEWAYLATPSSLSTFSFTVSYPAGTTGSQELSPTLRLRSAGKAAETIEAPSVQVAGAFSSGGSPGSPAQPSTPSTPAPASGGGGGGGGGSPSIWFLGALAGVAFLRRFRERK